MKIYWASGLIALFAVVACNQSEPLKKTNPRSQSDLESLRLADAEKVDPATLQKPRFSVRERLVRGTSAPEVVISSADIKADYHEVSYCLASLDTSRNPGSSSCARAEVFDTATVLSPFGNEAAYNVYLRSCVSAARSTNSTRCGSFSSDPYEYYQYKVTDATLVSDLKLLSDLQKAQKGIAESIIVRASSYRKNISDNQCSQDAKIELASHNLSSSAIYMIMDAIEDLVANGEGDSLSLGGTRNWTSPFFQYKDGDKFIARPDRNNSDPFNDKYLIKVENKNYTKREHYLRSDLEYGLVNGDKVTPIDVNNLAGKDVNQLVVLTKAEGENAASESRPLRPNDVFDAAGMPYNMKTNSGEFRRFRMGRARNIVSTFMANMAHKITDGPLDFAKKHKVSAVLLALVAVGAFFSLPDWEGMVGLDDDSEDVVRDPTDQGQNATVCTSLLGSFQTDVNVGIEDLVNRQQKIDELRTSIFANP